MVTIYDIARATGLAKSTVANALSGKGTVSEATRRRILQCAEEMGYRPNMVARSLSNHKTSTIAVILPTISNPFYPEIVEAIEQTALEHGYQTLICNTHYNFEHGRLRMERLRSGWVDGYIIMGSSMDITDITGHFQQDIPIVLCDWQENEAPQGIPQVSVDFFRAGQLAAQHLLELGHRDLAVIVDDPQQSLRQAGFLSILQARGLSLPGKRILPGNSTLESGYNVAKSLFKEEQPPTAIFAATDLMAIGAIEAALDAGLRVPEDVSIIGLDDIFVSAHIRPPLTTVAVPKLQLAQAATHLLFAQINGEAQVSDAQLVEPHLVLRRSTATYPIT
ncbi:LacI family transcriptional regulator [Ktedonobacter sp. SOSP1-85]|uniref:LacI family DNA-binding transcriptional regulator n=1 Tax=Ktedonobacter sp. SOSP1-85 TaxID=2778367 RepID=UPI00191535EA|nr:LacI family DNA-binding transcriptional regulator [Ktedonobacter sp. SOSP1-85]GHO78723.1 LacI family transcriptional regulator [Ktedonobacter sp. SOSP1-85]